MSTSCLAQIQHFVWSAAWQEEVGCWFWDMLCCLPAPALQQTLLQLLTRACFSSLLDLEGVLEVRQVERGCFKLTRAHQKYEKMLWRGIILIHLLR